MPSTEQKFSELEIAFMRLLHFHLKLMSKSVNLKILGLKLVKLDCIIL